ncbi:MAG: bifunctional UDP-N-acetylglucosamine diphosphorylase/glucosamine-1-phosphate N-acetyltransferase GlmU [Propionibacteriales bacterium]|nr:bifunctional UDP-N-acetylglucosamine diphosphorylase/glucosamine-1-phosphate N-acetyltransferase GlmU [Propionibacteriales bacterium]
MTTDGLAAVIVLAAGGGTRMRSATPKVLHAIGGRSLVGHAITAARDAGPEHLVVVVRHERDRVVDHVSLVDPMALIADQDDVPGTGRAVECGLAVLPDDVVGTVLVTMGDAPLLTGETLRGLVTHHVATGAAVTVVTATLDDPSGYGRIIRSDDGEVVANVEHKDATDEQLAICEVNAGMYAFDVAALRRALRRVGRDNAQGEKYLTDVLAILHADQGRVSGFPIHDGWQTEGVNDRVQLARLGAELNRRIVEGWMREGVTVVDPKTTWIDADVALGRDVTIHPQTQIFGASTIGSDVVIGPDSTIADVEVGDGAAIIRTHATLAVIGPGARVGPFSYLRPGTVLGAGGKIGTFVETKNAQIGDGAKVPHLSYVGDAEIGAATNIGAGTIFANYDGVNKHKTTVGAHANTGANNTFVAPINIGDGAATGGGTVVRRDVAPGALAVSTGPQRNIDDWVHRKRAGSRAADAATAAASRDSEDQA